MNARFSTKSAEIAWIARTLVLILAGAWWSGSAWGNEVRNTSEPASPQGEAPAEPRTSNHEPRSQGVPEITAISPTWGPSGWVLSLTLQGHNLAGASEVRFVPSTGIVVEDTPVINDDGTTATVKVTILMHAPLGPRLVVVRTPHGTSSLTPNEANIFKVSFAHLH